MRRAVVGYAHSFDADRSGGSRFQRIPGKIQDGPGKCWTHEPRPNPTLSIQPKGGLSMSISLLGDDLYCCTHSAPVIQGGAR